VRSIGIVVVDEFPVERESGVFLVVGSEPPFNLPLRRVFPDAPEIMFDPMLLAVSVEV
jgi:hypothetical protein